MLKSNNVIVSCENEKVDLFVLANFASVYLTGHRILRK